MSSLNHRNVGTIDRAIRGVLGIIALVLVFSGQRSGWGYLGLALLLTAAVGYCPLYAVLGIHTGARKKLS